MKIPFKSQHVLNLFENIYNKILSDLSFSDIKKLRWYCRC